MNSFTLKQAKRFESPYRISQVIFQIENTLEMTFKSFLKGFEFSMNNTNLGLWIQIFENEIQILE